MPIFVFDKDDGKVVEVKEAPIKFDDTRNHVNMRTTWSSQTKIEFSSTTMDQDIANRRAK
jgi:hypothetical protein|tara:strand:+ start:554 stop:733 length:180 start_codon:yes stop_codon:yes gene_type:complete